MNIRNINPEFLWIFGISIIGFILRISLFFLLDCSQYQFYDTDTWVFVKMISQIVGISPIVIFNVFGFFPPIVSFIFAFAVYFLVRRLYSDRAAFYSAIMIAIGPGIFFQNGLFGIIDHHLLQSCLFTIVILSLLIGFKERSVSFFLLSGIGYTILFFVSPVLIYIYTGIIGFLLILQIYPINKKVFVVILILSCILGYHYFNNLLSFFFYLDPISEIAYPNLLVMLMRFNILVVVFIAAIIIYFGKRSDNFPLISLLLVSLLSLGLALRFERMEYIFSPYLVIICAIFLSECYSQKVAKLIVIYFVIISFIIGMIVVNDVYTSAKINSGWNGAIDYLNGRPQGTVLTWGDYGYWINTTTKDITITDSSWRNAKEVSLMFIYGNVSKPIDYIIVTENDRGYYDAMKFYSGSSLDYNQSFLKRLINGTVNNTPLYSNNRVLVYQSI